MQIFTIFSSIFHLPLFNSVITAFLLPWRGIFMNELMSYLLISWKLLFTSLLYTFFNIYQTNYAIFSHYLPSEERSKRSKLSIHLFKYFFPVRSLSMDVRAMIAIFMQMKIYAYWANFHLSICMRFEGWQCGPMNVICLMLVLLLRLVRRWSKKIIHLIHVPMSSRVWVSRSLINTL